MENCPARATEMQNHVRFPSCNHRPCRLSQVPKPLTPDRINTSGFVLTPSKMPSAITKDALPYLEISFLKTTKSKVIRDVCENSHRRETEKAGAVRHTEAAAQDKW